MENQFTFNEEAAMETGTQGGYLETGVHAGTILACTVEVASTGTTGMNWIIQVEGQKFPTTIYGMWTHKANGDEIFNAKTVQRLMGLNKIKKLTVKKQEIDTKNGKVTVDCYAEFKNLPVVVSLQKVLDFYNGEVNEKKFEIKEFFNKKNQTYAEQVKGGEAKQFIWHSEKLKDGATDDYKKFIADGGADEPDEPAAEASGDEGEGDGIL